MEKHRTIPEEALRLLLDAFEQSEEFGRMVQELALSMASLTQLGLRETDLHWLVLRGYLSHLVAAGDVQHSQRALVEASHQAFGCHSYFVLTDAGARWARQQLHAGNGAAGGRPSAGDMPGDGKPILPLPPRPQWDPDAHTLWWGANVVKRFPHPGGAQEPILEAVEKARWKAPIPIEPLRHGGKTLKGAIRSALYRLNEHQQVPLIEFSTDASGRHILWRRRG